MPCSLAWWATFWYDKCGPWGVLYYSTILSFLLHLSKTLVGLQWLAGHLATYSSANTLLYYYYYYSGGTAVVAGAPSDLQQRYRHDNLSCRELRGVRGRRCVLY